MILEYFFISSLTGIIKISDQVLEHLRTAKFLGIQLDDRLPWKCLIKSRNMGMLYKISNIVDIPSSYTIYVYISVWH